MPAEIDYEKLVIVLRKFEKALADYLELNIADLVENLLNERDNLRLGICKQTPITIHPKTPRNIAMIYFGKVWADKHFPVG